MDNWIYDKLHSKLPQLNGLTALDLGCGEGSNSIGLAKLGAKVTALDRQTTAIEYIQKLAHKENVEILTKISTIQNFQSNAQYNIVLFTFVLHFLPSNIRTQTVQEVIDLVKPGGTLVFADLEDDHPVPPECLSIFKNSLKNIETEKLTVKDDPHREANYPHQHKVLYLIGTKK